MFEKCTFERRIPVLFLETRYFDNALLKEDFLFYFWKPGILILSINIKKKLYFKAHFTPDNQIKEGDSDSHNSQVQPYR